MGNSTSWYDFFTAAALLLACSHAATIKRSTTPENTDPSPNLPWNNIFSFFSYYATSTPSYDTSSDGDSWQDDCKEEQDSPFSETIITYDVEEQVLPSKNSTATKTNSTKIRWPKRKRDTGESTGLEGRHNEVRPYPGFFMGRRLWYVPLWFGIYYSFYLLCLVVRSVARHRINYPALLPADTTLERKKSRQKNKNLDAMARHVSDSVQMYNKYYRPYQ